MRPLVSSGGIGQYYLSVENGAPWWWLRAEEASALGIGPGAERTAAGVVFGDARAKVRLEIVARDASAPLQLGPISVRVWGGDTADPAVVALLRRVGRTLHARGGRDFHPDEAPLPRGRAGDASEAPRQTVAASTLVDVPSVCSRACAFCGISLVAHENRRPRGDDARVEREIDAARSPVLFTGDDAASRPELAAWIRRAATHGPVSLVGPPRAGRETALAPILAAAGLARWSSGIFGATAEGHDAVAGESGALQALREACEAYRAAGVEVAFIAPLTTLIAEDLSRIVALGASWSGRAVVVQLYIPDPSVGAALDRVVASFRVVRRALAAADPRHTAPEGAPPCVVPPSMRRPSQMLERSETMDMAHPSATCTACPLRSGCAGVASTSVRAVGSDGLGEM